MLLLLCTKLSRASRAGASFELGKGAYTQILAINIPATLELHQIPCYYERPFNTGFSFYQ